MREPGRGPSSADGRQDDDDGQDRAPDGLMITPVASELNREQVSALAHDVETADAVAAFSEQSMLHLHRPPAQSAGNADGPSGCRHLFRFVGDELAGYAHLDLGLEPGELTSAELCVAPAHRRSGHGSVLLAGLVGFDPAVRVWAHGNLPNAVRFAEDHGWRVVRELWLMGTTITDGQLERNEGNADRPAAEPPRVEPALPEGFTVHPFTPADAEDWSRVNARAFATHPEQGRTTAQDLADRMAQPWFDPAGFLLVHDHSDPRSEARLAAFHWTKTTEDIGEVYVLGVDPDYQGRRLSGPLTWIGLNHLRDKGVREVHLYVESDNHPAVATYRKAGFNRLGVDAMYAGPVLH